jgi:hypothetical protein
MRRGATGIAGLTQAAAKNHHDHNDVRSGRQRQRPRPIAWDMHGRCA